MVEILSFMAYVLAAFLIFMDCVAQSVWTPRHSIYPHGRFAMYGYFAVACLVGAALAAWFGKPRAGYRYLVSALVPPAFPFVIQWVGNLFVN